MMEDGVLVECVYLGHESDWRQTIPSRLVLVCGFQGWTFRDWMEQTAHNQFDILRDFVNLSIVSAMKTTPHLQIEGKIFFQSGTVR